MPVTNVNQTSADSKQVTIDLPSDSEQTEYFDEYVIYYKIYTTNLDASENSNIETNRKTIENANENNPTSLEIVLKNLNFKTITFGEDKGDNYSSVSNPLSKKEDSDINGQTLIIDFNLNSLGKDYPVIVKEDGNTFKLLRNEELGFSEIKYQNLTYHETFETKNNKDYIGANGEGFAHAMLFIVASGHDYNLSPLHSTAKEIGVFLLEDRD